IGDAALGLGVIAAPKVRLGLQEAQLSAQFILGATLDAARGPLQRRLEIAALERLLRRATVPGGRALGLAAALPVLGEQLGLALARLLQPLRRQAVAELAIFGDQRRIGRLAQQRVAEDVLGLAGEIAA